MFVCVCLFSSKGDKLNGHVRYKIIKQNNNNCSAALQNRDHDHHFHRHISMSMSATATGLTHSIFTRKVIFEK